MLVIAIVTLTLPGLARADEYDNEMRMLDLEMQMLHLCQQAIDAESREASRERAAFMKEFQDSVTKPRPFTPAPMSLDEPYIPYSDPRLSMRPPWLQPADPWVPMPDSDRARMFCAGPDDCWLHQKR
jgi:hypothetical protein